MNKTKMKHTPGPWWIDWGSWKDGHCDISSNGWSAFALVVTEFDKNEDGIDKFLSEQGKANARLIAAAPDMLDWIIEYIRPRYKNYEKEDWEEYKKHNPNSIRLVEEATGMKIKDVMK